MSEGSLLLRARAAGREFLLPLADLREVVEAAPATPIPGGPTGILGVVLHEGEFLPVLDWSLIERGPASASPPVVLAVLRPRLGLPLEGLSGTVEAPEAGRHDPPEDDPWAPVLSGMIRIADEDLPLLDPDRLVSLLHRLRHLR